MTTMSICKTLVELDLTPGTSFVTDDWMDDSRNITVGADTNSIEVDSLQPAYDYTVRMFANNSIGLSAASTLVSVTTAEEAPNGPPTNVKVIATGSQSLKVTWQVRIKLLFLCLLIYSN